ncbi:hypothetical protein M885DRAFT_503436 [Pelagophyceae sp. CCMP2097]|nr:hypothetical protein M885DRAFT_503436 [Pelagophyceae sp. CCMP2097]
MPEDVLSFRPRNAESFRPSGSEGAAKPAEGPPTAAEATVCGPPPDSASHSGAAPSAAPSAALQPLFTAPPRALQQRQQYTAARLAAPKAPRARAAQERQCGGLFEEKGEKSRQEPRKWPPAPPPNYGGFSTTPDVAVLRTTRQRRRAARSRTTGAP